MTRRPPLLMCAALILLASPVFAQGLYVGGGFGRTSFGTEVGVTATQVDDTAAGWKLFGGISSRFFGVEGGYRDFGTVKVNSLSFKSDTTAWDVAAFGRLRVPILDAFAKAGTMWWSRNTRVGSASDDATGTNFFWGMGVGVHLGPLGARVEWEWVKLPDPDKLSMVSVSGTLGF
jgi:hypothetical protein